jgi:hypothetical protein
MRKKRGQKGTTKAGKGDDRGLKEKKKGSKGDNTSTKRGRQGTKTDEILHLYSDIKKYLKNSGYTLLK